MFKHWKWDAMRSTLCLSCHVMPYHVVELLSRLHVAMNEHQNTAFLTHLYLCVRQTIFFLATKTCGVVVIGLASAVLVCFQSSGIEGCVTLRLTKCSSVDVGFTQQVTTTEGCTDRSLVGERGGWMVG